MKTCMFCGENVEVDRFPERLGGSELYKCSNCGRYVIADSTTFNADKCKTMAYLFYNKNRNPIWTSFLGNEIQYKKYLIDRETDIEITNITSEMVEEWYPKTFKDKINLILLKLAEISEYDGAYICIKNFAKELFFCRDIRSKGVEEECDVSVQIEYMSDYLTKNDFLINLGGWSFQLTPKAFEKIYALQKNQKTCLL